MNFWMCLLEIQNYVGFFSKSRFDNIVFITDRLWQSVCYKNNVVKTAFEKKSHVVLDFKQSPHIQDYSTTDQWLCGATHYNVSWCCKKQL